MYLADLDKLSRTDATAFQAFWLQFGAVVKEGLYDAVEHRDDILKIARFHSTYNSDMTSLDSYVERMKDGQDCIYYMSGENVDHLRHSPQIEGFKKRGLDVLLFHHLGLALYALHLPCFVISPSFSKPNVTYRYGLFRTKIE